MNTLYIYDIFLGCSTYLLVPDINQYILQTEVYIEHMLNAAKRYSYIYYFFNFNFKLIIVIS